MAKITSTNFVALAHWRRSVAESYARVRQSEDPLLAWQQFNSDRNHLLKTHQLSPLDPGQRSSFRQLQYYDYEPTLRVFGYLDYGVQALDLNIELADDGLLRITRVALIRFELSGQNEHLSLFWIQGYGGGLFLPFKDQTNRTETFGGGRYLYDTIKGADLGVNEVKILLDFNFAYNPSCAYNARWVCPLAPQENRLNADITAGEKRFETVNEDRGQ